MKAAIILENGFEDIEALGCVDILRRAHVDVTIYGNELIVTSSHRIKVSVDELLNDNILNSDILILPGGGIGTINLKNDKKVINYIIQFNNKNKLIAAICAAPTVLKYAKILDNKKVTVYPDDAYINEIGDNYINELVYCDQNIITSCAAGHTFNFAFLILQKLGINPNKIKEDIKL